MVDVNEKDFVLRPLVSGMTGMTVDDYYDNAAISL